MAFSSLGRWRDEITVRGPCPYAIVRATQVLRGSSVTTALKVCAPSGTVLPVQDRLVFGIATLVLLAGCASGSVCGTGYREVEGRCEFSCEDACNDHQDCFETANGGECQCVVGYAGDPCEWTGALQDPDFTSPETWSATPGVAIEPLAAGLTGEGIASFESTVVCNAGAVSQFAEMPPYDLADPLVVEVTFRSQEVNGVHVGYNRASRKLVGTGQIWSTDRFCLGEAAYGGPVKFEVAAFERASSCFSNPIGTLEVDRFDVVVADPGECPQPGDVLNGRADLDEPGWEFETENGNPGGLPEAELKAGVGEASSSGARLYKPGDSQNLAGMYTQLSVPLPSTLPSPALRFWWKGSLDRLYYVDLGTYPGTRARQRRLDTLVGDGLPQGATYCLPPWTHGNVADLSFVLIGTAESELIVDNVEIVSDPRCGDYTDLLDPSFDSFPNRWPGAGYDRVTSVQLIDDAERARPPGSGALEIAYTDNHARVDFEHWVWIPPSDGDRFPVLRFHSKVAQSPGPSVFWALGSGTGPGECIGDFCPPIPLSQSLPLGGDWQPNDVCLPAEWSERWFRFRIAVRPSDDPLEVFEAPRSVLLDDFEVTLDEGCLPAE